MSNDAVNRYLEAYKEYRRATETAKEIVKTIQDGAETLKNWPKVEVGLNALPFPVASVKPYFYIQKWPTGQNVAQAPDGWHQALARLKEASAQVPDDLREAFRPLPTEETT